jgi:hypothetical protein
VIKSYPSLAKIAAIISTVEFTHAQAAQVILMFKCIYYFVIQVEIVAQESFSKLVKSIFSDCGAVFSVAVFCGKSVSYKTNIHVETTHHIIAISAISATNFVDFFVIFLFINE